MGGDDGHIGSFRSAHCASDAVVRRNRGGEGFNELNEGYAVRQHFFQIIFSNAGISSAYM